MSFAERLTLFSFDHPRVVAGGALLVTLLAVLPFGHMRIDTDPENMLAPSQPDRVLYDRLKRDFGLHDMLVVGIIDERGIYRTEALERVARAIGAIEQIPGVIQDDVVSLTTTDHAKSVGRLVEIHPVMERVPRTQAEVDALKRDIAGNDFLNGKIVSTDGRAAAIYVPIRSKDQSFRIGAAIEAVMKRELLPGQRYHLAGLPVAEDTFGHEMFVQMAVVAPLAFLGILVLIYLLFRQAAFLLPVGLTALLSVIWTMGALIATGQTVHIMGSMIPIFLMPIAILDSIHILSELHDRSREAGSRRAGLLAGMKSLYRPMLFTSLTSAVGFASLGLANIPPVRVFGLFVAVGIMVAWALTHTLLPACFAWMPEPEPAPGRTGDEDVHPSVLDRTLRRIGRVAFGRARAVALVSLALALFGVGGVLRLKSDDNPVRWFQPGHRVRVADEEMNRRFGGTYMANLLLQGDGADAMKRPDVLRYLVRVQRRLESDPLVGKTSSVADIVRRINRVLHGDDPAYDRIPDSEEDIGQYLFLFQGSGDPAALDHLIDPDGRQANLWVQMRGGDNGDMEHVENLLAGFVSENPPPRGITLRWSGLNHINKVWQRLMVSGMLQAVLGSLVIVLALMIFEFRSWTMGILSMIPLSAAILLSYGLIGWVGKRYDMPIAVCSALSLGLGIDFAIHFLERFRTHWRRTRSVGETNAHMFGPAGRAIARNAIVVSVGFLPLAISSLTPYVTVGLFFATLMILSALATLFLMPAALRLLGPKVLA